MAFASAQVLCPHALTVDTSEKGLPQVTFQNPHRPGLAPRQYCLAYMVLLRPRLPRELPLATGGASLPPPPGLSYPLAPVCPALGQSSEGRL